MSDPGTPAPAGLGRTATVVAVVLVAAFLAMLALLAAMRDDPHWDRLIFLLGGLEAITFAAAGALFGTAVQRGNVESARQDAAAARQDAEAERARADTAEQDGAAGRFLSAAIQNKAEQEAAGPQQAAPDQRLGGRPDEAPRPTPARDPGLAELAALARRMFPAAPPAAPPVSPLEGPADRPAATGHRAPEQRG